jgi:hypothetical protein
MTIWFRVKIDDEVHQVKVEIQPGQSPDEIAALRESVISTAYLEHYGRVPKGVINSFD